MQAVLSEMEIDRRAVTMRHSTTPSHDCVEVTDFAAAMRVLASGVVVITTYVDDRPWGLTLSSVSSFSADPARISLSITKSNATASYIRENEKFGVAILPADRADLAEALAARGAPKFIDPTDLSDSGPILGVPRIASALVNLECKVVFHVEAIDHILIVADVVSASAEADLQRDQPLVYYSRMFGSFAPSESEGVTR